MSRSSSQILVQDAVSPSDHHKPRRRYPPVREKFNDDQRKVLESIYRTLDTSNLSGAGYGKISTTLSAQFSVKPSRVKKWFDNRVQKERRAQKQGLSSTDEEPAEDRTQKKQCRHHPFDVESPKETSEARSQPMHVETAAAGSDSGPEERDACRSSTAPEPEAAPSPNAGPPHDLDRGRDRDNSEQAYGSTPAAPTRSSTEEGLPAKERTREGHEESSSPFSTRAALVQSKCSVAMAALGPEEMENEGGERGGDGDEEEDEDENESEDGLCGLELHFEDETLFDSMESCILPFTEMPEVAMMDDAGGEELAADTSRQGTASPLPFPLHDRTNATLSLLRSEAANLWFPLSPRAPSFDEDELFSTSCFTGSRSCSLSTLPALSPTTTRLESSAEPWCTSPRGFEWAAPSVCSFYEELRCEQ